MTSEVGPSQVLRGCVDPDFWCGKRVLLTGHTGFKGAWASLWLAQMGAIVTGFALPPESEESLFARTDVANDIASHLGDLNDAEAVRRAVASANPEIVLHLAAQALVRRSVEAPVETVATNTLGTVRLLDALRQTETLKAVLVVTTDKVYENPERGVPFREGDPLGGHDPYAASKAAAEVLTHAMARTYFDPRGVPVATARGGNVIGGGDTAADRLVPDIVRALQRGEPVRLRHPQAIRPWQHVLDCLAGYFVYVQALVQHPNIPRSLNIGPDPSITMPVRTLTEALLEAFSSSSGWTHETTAGPQESATLTLDTHLARETLGWKDHWPAEKSITATAEWYRGVREGHAMRDVTLTQIRRFEAEQTPS